MVYRASHNLGLSSRQLIVVAALAAFLALQVSTFEHVHTGEAPSGCEVCHHAADASLPDTIVPMAPGPAPVPYATVLHERPTTPPTVAFTIRAPPVTS